MEEAITMPGRLPALKKALLRPWLRAWYGGKAKYRQFRITSIAPGILGP